MKNGPNDTSGIIWAISKFFFLFSFVFNFYQLTYLDNLDVLKGLWKATIKMAQTMHLALFGPIVSLDGSCHVQCWPTSTKSFLVNCLINYCINHSSTPIITICTIVSISITTTTTNFSRSCPLSLTWHISFCINLFIMMQDLKSIQFSFGNI